MADDLVGRVAMCCAPLSAYTVGIGDDDPIVPKDEELVYDDSSPNHTLGVIHFTDEVTWEFRSAAGENLNTLTDMDTSGILTNAKAAAIDKELTFFIFDPTQRVIRPNYKLVFPDSYRYYAIKSTTELPEYITGHEDGNGDIISYLVDMEIIPAEVGEGNVAHPAIGSLLPDATPVSGHIYIIEFYDASQVLIARDSYHAKVANIQELDMTPDLAVDHIAMTSGRPVDGEPDACFLYEHESTDQLAIRYLLYYTDGSHRDITHEIQTGGKLVITNLETIDTGVLTPFEADPPEFIATYSLVPVDDISPVTVEATFRLYIREDPATNLVKVIPAYWYDGSANMASTFFGLYDSGALVNIDGRIGVGDLLPATFPAQVTVETDVNVTVNVGVSGQTSLDFLFYLKLYEQDAPVVIEAQTTLLNVWGNLSDRDYRSLIFDSATNRMKLEGDDETDLEASFESFRDSNEYDDDGTPVTPTHFRVRNLSGTAYFTPGIGIPIADYLNFAYVLGSYPVTENPVLLIEFLDVDTSGAEDIINRVTNARVYYTYAGTVTL